MINRGSMQLLWGYRPLVFFIALWSAIVSFRLWLKSRKKDAAIRWRWLGLTYGSAVLLSVGFPDIIPAPLLMFVGLCPLVAIRGRVKSGKFREVR